MTMFKSVNLQQICYKSTKTKQRRCVAKPVEQPRREICEWSGKCVPSTYKKEQSSGTKKASLSLLFVSRLSD